MEFAPSMHQPLIDYINSRLTEKLSESEISILKLSFKPRKLRRHQYFLQAGEVCKYAGFIVKGAVKQYTVDETGKESILGLLIENWWAADRESFMNETPSPYFFDAFEQTELLVVTRDENYDLLMKQRFIGELFRVLSERQATQLLKRVHATKSLTAEQRLDDFERSYPQLVQRFPQHIIASYLGMTKETLSRIRRRKK